MVDLTLKSYVYEISLEVLGDQVKISNVRAIQINTEYSDIKFMTNPCV